MDEVVVTATDVVQTEAAAVVDEAAVAAAAAATEAEVQEEEVVGEAQVEVNAYEEVEFNAATTQSLDQDLGKERVDRNKQCWLDSSSFRCRGGMQGCVFSPLCMSFAAFFFFFFFFFFRCRGMQGFVSSLLCMSFAFFFGGVSFRLGMACS